MQRRLTVAGVRTISLAGRHHQLRDARAGPADARVRRWTGSPVRWSSAGPLAGERLTTLDGVARVLDAEDMVICEGDAAVGRRSDLAGRRDGRRDQRGRRRHRQRAVRGGALGSGDGRPDRPPAQAVQRGGQALGARRRPGAAAGRAGSGRSSCSSSTPAARSTSGCSTSTRSAARPVSSCRRTSRPGVAGVRVPGRAGWSSC